MLSHSSIRGATLHWRLKADLGDTSTARFVLWLSAYLPSELEGDPVDMRKLVS